MLGVHGVHGVDGVHGVHFAASSYVLLKLEVKVAIVTHVNLGDDREICKYINLEMSITPESIEKRRIFSRD